MRAVARHDRQVPLAEVDADRDARSASQRDQPRRASAAKRGLLARRVVTLDHQAGVLQLGDQRRDRGGRQAGAARHLCATGHAQLRECLHHALSVQLAQRRKRSGSLTPHAAAILCRAARVCQAFAITTVQNVRCSCENRQKLGKAGGDEVTSDQPPTPARGRGAPPELDGDAVARAAAARSRRGT